MRAVPWGANLFTWFVSFLMRVNKVVVIKAGEERHRRCERTEYGIGSLIIAIAVLDPDLPFQR